jgi:hypothetical protein
MAGKKSGKLTAGFGSQHHVGGGKSLMVDLRPPSDGPLTDDKSKDKAGIYYNLLIEHVKEILADPKKVYPDFNAKEGCELAGFVWFQGFNDMVGAIPQLITPKAGKASRTIPNTAGFCPVSFATCARTYPHRNCLS